MNTLKERSILSLRKYYQKYFQHLRIAQVMGALTSACCIITTVLHLKTPVVLIDGITKHYIIIYVRRNEESC